MSHLLVAMISVISWLEKNFILFCILVLCSSPLHCLLMILDSSWLEERGQGCMWGLALMAFLTSSHRLYPQPFSDRASDGRPTKRRWINLPIEVEICYKVRTKTKISAHLSNPREIAYSVMVKFKETHDLAGRPFRWVFDPCQCSMYEVWMWSPNCAHYLRFQPSHRGLAIIDFRPKLMVLLSISVLITSLGNSGLQS